MTVTATDYEILSIQGATLTDIVVNEQDDEITFRGDDGRVWFMHHKQDCCESVWIEDVCGDVQDLVGTPILRAEVRDQDDDEDNDRNWTFYELATIKGSVTLRWCGQSEYYSTSVNFVEVRDEQDEDDGPEPPMPPQFGPLRVINGGR